MVRMTLLRRTAVVTSGMTRIPRARAAVTTWRISSAVYTSEGPKAPCSES